MSKPLPVRQQGKSFGFKAKVAMLDRGLSVTMLAAKIQRPRSSVSRAINQGCFSLLRRLIAKELGL